MNVSLREDSSLRKQPAEAAVRQFIRESGNLGEWWGINRSMAQVFALLMTSAVH